MMYKIIRTILWAIFLAFIPYFLYINSDLSTRLVGNLESLVFALLLLNVVVSWLFRSARDITIYREMGCHISYLKLLALNNQQLLLNYLPMKLGTVHLALQLRNEHQFEYTGFAGSFLLQHILMNIVASCFSFVAILVFGDMDNNLSIFLLFSLVLMNILLFAILFIRVRFKWLPEVVTGKFLALHQHIHNFSKTHRLFFLALSFSIVMHLLAVWRLYLLSGLLGLDVGIVESFLFGSISQVSLFFAITPGGLGIREFFMGTLTSLFGFDIASGVLLSLADRVVIIFFSLIFLFVTGLVHLFSSMRPGSDYDVHK